MRLCGIFFLIMLKSILMSKALIKFNNQLSIGSPIGSIDAYIQSVNRIPMLSANDERMLVGNMQAGDVDSARALAMAHLRFVVHIAKRYSGYGLALSDLIQEGNVGLLEAIKRFDLKANVRLVTYAVYWIKARINDFVIENVKIVKIATTKAQRKLFFKLRSLQKNWFDKQDIDFIAETLDVTEKDVLTMVTRLYTQDSALLDDQPDEIESHEAPAYSVIGDVHYSPEKMLERTDQTNISAALDAIDTLDERSALIIRSRWLSETKQTFAELADELGISIERVRQIEKAALTQLKQQLNSIY